MKRTLIDKLIKWKNKPDRKPLILEGARQTGKTWILKEFGKREYKNTIYLLFEQNAPLQAIFRNPSNISFIIRSIAALYGKIGEPSETLLIFDEIQACPEAMTSLKYFHELAPEYHIAAAGSLLGISEHSDYAFPVGKVEFLNLYPMSFSEFLLAMGRSAIAEAIENEDYDLLSIMKDECSLLYKQYMYVGGMPEAVDTFAKSNGTDYITVQSVLHDILKSYANDFSKHIKNESERKKVEIIWDAIPSQLAKENKKFIFSALKGSNRASSYEEALKWLSDAGLIHIINLLRTQKVPTSAYEDKTSFKTYMLDTGLLAAKAGLSHKAIISDSEIFVEFKGAIAEQYACQELVATNNLNIHYYANDNNTSKVEFILDDGNRIYPLEIKSGINVKARSLMAYRSKFNPSLSFRASLKGYEENEQGLISLPLFALSNIEKIIERKENL